MFFFENNVNCFLLDSNVKTINLSIDFIQKDFK